MKSMTGYGQHKESIGDRTISAEIRAVNHRYFDCTVKAPRMYGFLEDAVKKMTGSSIARGKVEVHIAVEHEDAGDISVGINQGIAGQYLAALQALRDTYALKDDISVMQLAKLSDVLEFKRVEQDADEMTHDVIAVLETAVSRFNAMRELEGEKLRRDMEERLNAIELMVSEVETLSPERVAQYREKLLARMQEVLGDTTIDEQRILTEAAIFADKTAVDEETVRLRSHLSQMKQMLAEDGAIGRKLDFIVQEMNREANTIGSKANDACLSKIVVDMKSEIEKIREQVQNVE